MAKAGEGVKKICFPFVGDSIGGSHLSTLLLIETLDKSRFEPVIVLHEKGVLSSYLDDLKIEYKLLPLPCYAGQQKNVPMQLIALIRTFKPLFSFIRQNRIKIVHTNDGRMHLSWVLPARFSLSKFFWHQRTRFAPSRLPEFMVRLANKVLCISEYVKETLPLTVKNRAVVVNNPVKQYINEEETQKIRKKLLKEAKKPDYSIIIGTFGNLRGVKQPLSFIKSCILVKKEMERSFVFAVFGEDREEYIPRMKELAKEAGCEDSLFFAGFRTPAEPWIAACDVIVAPSIQDAFGRTLVEAMLAGTPVVATDAGGHSEIITNGKTGFLVPVNDEEKMAEAIQVFLRNEKSRKDITENAAEYALKYAPEKYISKIEEIYDGK